MEFRAQEPEMRTSGSLGYTHLSKEASGGGERRRVGNNGGSLNCTTQTLDYPRHLQQQPTRDPEQPDRVGSAGAKPKPPATGSVVRYRECLKNHAASIGGNVFDGCGEFMPSGEEGSLEALKCAACQCHRNFHRKEVDGETQYSPSSRRSSLMLSPLQLPPPLPSPSSFHHHNTHKFSMGFHGNNLTAPIVQPMNVAFGSGGGTESSSEDLPVYHSSADGLPPPPFALSKKRFRTKFTQEQKEKMLEFAEKVGWRIQKQDEEEVEKFCAELGVRRQVLKVWMHNNKSNIKKQQEMGSDHQSIEMAEAAEVEGIDM
ncbi:hypothetical protein UlMin_034245 [Ulmus minor]